MIQKVNILDIIKSILTHNQPYIITPKIKKRLFSSNENSQYESSLNIIINEYISTFVFTCI